MNRESKIRSYILGASIFAAYPVINNIAFLKDRFNQDYGFKASRVGETQAVREWLGYAPECLNIPTNAFEVIELGREWEFLDKDSNEKDGLKFLASFHDIVGHRLQLLFRKIEDL